VLRLIMPGEKRRYVPGETFEIGWIAAQGRVAAVRIGISLDGGKEWVPLIGGAVDTSDSRWGNFKWTVPLSLYSPAQARSVPCAGRSGLLKITDAENDSIFDISDAPFEIASQRTRQSAPAAPQAADTTPDFAIWCSPEQEVIVRAPLEGEFSVTITSANGTLVASHSGMGPAEYMFDNFPTGGVYIVRVRNDEKKQAKIIIINK
jgi:hypothetical protein